MRIALAQVNPVIGDVEANAGMVAGIIREAGLMGADLVVFPEMVVTGYPPRDLLERPVLAERSVEAVRRIATATTGGPAAIVGFPEPSTGTRTRPLRNAAALLAGGRVQAVYHKRLLPSYDVFDEDRWFQPGEAPGVMELGGLRLGLLVCEDLWNHSTLIRKPRYPVDPLADLLPSSVSALVNPSASPFHAGKPRFRERMLAEVAAENRTPVLFVNQVGGNDELVFDGGSLAIGPDGRTVSRSPLFREHVALVELGEDGSLAGELSPWPDRAPEVLREAIVLGLGDYVRKCGFGHVVLGLSGGIDSALVAVLACEALGAGNVTALAMPSRFSSEASLRDAQLVASNLGIRLEVVSIEPAFDALVGTLDPWFAGTGFGLAEENLQARVRGTLVMAFSNKFGGLALATGNKSEIAVGYCTLYGDMVGAVAPIGDVLKTDVYEIARHINAGSPVIPGSILNKAPSAELRPGQKDEDTLPPYAELDNVLRRYLEEDAPVEEIVAGGVARETVARILEMVRRAEHKRSQAALVIRVSPRAFGPGRRYPIAQGFRE